MLPSFDEAGRVLKVNVNVSLGLAEARKHPLDFSDEKRLGTALEGCSVLQLGFDARTCGCKPQTPKPSAEACPNGWS